LRSKTAAANAAKQRQASDAAQSRGGKPPILVRPRLKSVFKTIAPHVKTSKNPLNV
jgi:hypothetical protein